MALRAKSLFLYGFEVTPLNASLDFRAVLAGPVIQATLSLGFYSLTGLLAEIKRAMEAADPLRVYTPTVDRSYAGGTENRVTIATNGSYLDLLFASGPREASSCCFLIGFAQVDQTGSTSYTGTSTAGTALVTTMTGYKYLPASLKKKNFGAVSVSASGVKESLTWAIQSFIQVEFKHEPQNKVIDEWVPFMEWAIQQRGFDFTPEISSPQLYDDVTLESTPADMRGLAWDMAEELPDFPFLYTTGLIKLRKRSS